MKIILFRGGKPGEIVSLPGEDPAVELSDLLGGEVNYTPTMYSHLHLVSLRHGKQYGLPVRYVAKLRKIHIPGDIQMAIAGDCAVIARYANGAIRDVKKDECLMANLMIREVP